MVLKITVKTLDSQNYQFEANEDWTVAQFKEHIQDTVNVVANEQRLIFCGRVLQNDLKLTEYDCNGKVIHLVRRPPPTQADEESNRRTANETQNDRFRVIPHLEGTFTITATTIDTSLSSNRPQATATIFLTQADPNQPGIRIPVTIPLAVNPQQPPVIRTQTTDSTPTTATNSGPNILGRSATAPLGQDPLMNMIPELAINAASHILSGVLGFPINATGATQQQQQQQQQQHRGSVASNRQKSGHQAHAYAGSYESARNSSRYGRRDGPNLLTNTPVEDSSNLSDSSDTVVGGDFVMVSIREAFQAANELAAMSTSGSSLGKKSPSACGKQQPQQQHQPQQQQQQQQPQQSPRSKQKLADSLDQEQMPRQRQHTPPTPPSPLQQLPPPLSPPSSLIASNSPKQNLNFFNSSQFQRHKQFHHQDPFAATAITARRPSLGNALTDVTNISPTLRFNLGSPAMSRFVPNQFSSPHQQSADNISSGGPTGISPPVFYALDLQEETLLDKEHNETLAKLNFVDSLVGCIVSLADSRSALTNLTTTDDETKPKALIELPIEVVRKVERLVLYLKASQLTSSALKLSKAEIQENRLRNSSSVRQVLRLLKDKFHHCLNMCKSLEYQATLSSSIGRTALELIAPDKLIYDYAIEMCQTAALEEMFGQPEECYKRYQTAQILLHGLLHQVSQDDKPVLEKYKLAVEKRLLMLQYHFQQQQQQILGTSSSSNMGGGGSPFCGQKSSSRYSY